MQQLGFLGACFTQLYGKSPSRQTNLHTMSGGKLRSSLGSNSEEYPPQLVDIPGERDLSPEKLVCFHFDEQIVQETNNVCKSSPKYLQANYPRILHIHIPHVALLWQ